MFNVRLLDEIHVMHGQVDPSLMSSPELVIRLLPVPIDCPDPCID